MSDDADTVKVPANGHRPRARRKAVPAVAPAASVDATTPTTASVEPTTPEPAPPPIPARVPPSAIPAPVSRAPVSPTMPVSPAQLAIGFGILASLVILALRRRRPRS